MAHGGYSGEPDVMFLDPATFPFTRDLVAHWQDVLDECLALPAREFDAWPETGLYNHGWEVYGLYLMDRPLIGNCVFCPRTTALVRDIPGLRTAGFSRLAPGTVIAPHVGYSSDVLRLHLGLQTPECCGLRVGGETRRWVAGECLIFDDTVEHEAWNRGHADRIVLLADFVKPRG